MKVPRHLMSSPWYISQLSDDININACATKAPTKKNEDHDDWIEQEVLAHTNTKAQTTVNVENNTRGEV